MKRLFSISTVALVLAGGLIFGTSSAQASIPQYNFQTEDGKWDGEIGNPNKGSNIRVELVGPIYLKTASGSKVLTDFSNVKVRLVNAKTGKTTSYHSLAGGSTVFTGMKMGKFYIDIKDGYAKGKISGKTQAPFLN